METDLKQLVNASNTLGYTPYFEEQRACKDAIAEITELRAIVAKLDRTIDGVYVFPGMLLYYIYTVKTHSWVGISRETEPRYCYSTREAAQAALAGKEAGR